MAHLLTQPHQNYNSTIEQPSFRTIRNQVEWKSDNYRIKETTSIQTGRKDRDTVTMNGLAPQITVGIKSVEETSEVPNSSTQRPRTGTYSDSLPLSSSTRIVAWKVPVANMEELKFLESSQEPRYSFLPDRTVCRSQCSFSEPSNRTSRQVPYLKLNQPG